MPAMDQSISEIIDAAVAHVVSGIRASIDRELVRASAKARSRALSARGRRGIRARGRVRRSPAELTKWVADRRARRVPKFVIAMTGLDTKKKIVAKFGEDAAFEKGKALPKPM